MCQAEGAMLKMYSILGRRRGTGRLAIRYLEQLRAVCRADFAPKRADTIACCERMGDRRRKGRHQDRKTCDPCGKVSCSLAHSHDGILSSWLDAPLNKISLPALLQRQQASRTMSRTKSWRERAIDGMCVQACAARTAI
jgi:hypothetical protein